MNNIFVKVSTPNMLSWTGHVGSCFFLFYDNTRSLYGLMHGADLYVFV